jgi:hypothetical protein
MKDSVSFTCSTYAKHDERAYVPNLVTSKVSHRLVSSCFENVI